MNLTDLLNSVHKALPLIAGLAMGAVSKSSQGGGSGSSLTDMLGSLSGDGDGFGVDDALDLAKKFF
jgi:outer membrane lipoprotein SlyB